MTTLTPEVIDKISASPKPAWAKTDFFESIFPHPIDCTEWVVRWPLEHSTNKGKHKTYNPDFWCGELQCFIEVATSTGNIVESKQKWQKAIDLGHALRVFWWTGIEITDLLREEPNKIFTYILSIDGIVKITAPRGKKPKPAK